MQIGFSGLLTLLFITLKLLGYIDWSWVWVVAPLWIGFAVLIFILLLMALVGGNITIKKR